MGEEKRPMVEILNATDVRVTMQRGGERHFSYDFAFDSSDRSKRKYATQEAVYEKVGHTILDNCMKGFNGCLFAYGQTGSGKSYTMAGCDKEEGIIPRINRAIFSAEASARLQQIRVWVSYLEIYNEHLHDLLADSSEGGKDLAVMEHPSLGVYVKAATEVVVRSEEDIEHMLEYGLKRRAEGATNMNAHSSRSHAVFRIRVECKHRGGPTVSSRVNLIDLAGSERQAKTGTSGLRLKEAGAINQSLSALGMVIKQLSDGQSKRKSAGMSSSSSSSATWIPFRSSKLTFLLKDSLVGNSKTFMIACISPASSEAEETLSTLRFASSVKKIKTVAKVNVDHKDQQISSLQNEISALRSQLQSQSLSRSSSQIDMLSIELDERQRLVEELKKSYDTQLAASQEILRLREEALDDMGLSSKEINTAFGVAHDTPYMLNISEDPMLSGCLLYYLKTNEAVGVGDPPHDLKHLDRVVFGRAHMMRIMIPKLADTTVQQVGSSRRRSSLMRPPVVEEKEHEEYAADLATFDESSEAYQELRHYIEELRLKLSSEKLDKFLQVLKAACPLIDEANDLSTELRPNRHFKFEAELIWDVFNSEGEDLIVIRLMEYTKAPEEGGADEKFRSKVLYYWGLNKFIGRLELMRDLYHQVSMGYLKKEAVLSGEYFETSEGKVHDPWSEPSIADIQAQQEFSSRLSQKRDIDKLQTAMASVVKADATQTGRRQTRVLSSVTGDTKLILQAPVSSSVVPSPKRRLSGGSESPGKKLSSPSIVAKERRSVAGGTETVRKEDVNGLMQAHFNEVKKLLANALGEMKSRKESEASVEEFRRRNEALEEENGKLLQQLAELKDSQKNQDALPSRAVAVVSFGRFLDSQMGGPYTAFSTFDVHGRKQISLSEFDSGLATWASAYRIAAGRDRSLPATTFGCETAVLFGYIDCLEKGVLTIDDFLFASACGTAHGRGLPLPESPIKVSRLASLTVKL
ncbi:kif1, putative [Perkinsus marinus ATCC 50983]|uniref:Kinesin-like protein n=1 Tax=Perkinsus marinus (strain ATCC 50983 / TXsc) TaxID=423536 RepID=C5LA70_PERM5|nr:kif1, putative [Perkinsus marinus ATCC 50983]EER06326.1 kif1, putative [Perkinsus marinus ATCC 50983]|eukprot:XP_002774510.1 kif1, putative [Perkinsus marinus ATCC 50983]